MSIQGTKGSGDDRIGHAFLDDQKNFIIDVSIICGGFQNIIHHEIKCSDALVSKLQILYTIVYDRYKLTLGLSDEIAGKQEICKGIGKLLVDITSMKDYCIRKNA